jgi:hypothetical protein
MTRPFALRHGLILGLLAARLFIPSIAVAAPLVFTGTVKPGESFEKQVGGNLYFHLDPLRDKQSHWTVRLSSAPGPAEDFIWVVTPPYRGDNGQILGPTYNRLTWNECFYPRRYYFVATDADYRKTRDQVETGVLWPYNHPDSAVKKALDRLGKDVAVGTCTVTIIRVEFADENQKNALSLDVLVRVDFPSGGAEEAFRPPPPKSLRDVPMKETVLSMMFAEPGDFLPFFGKENEQALRNAQYADLDGDGEEEAVVVAWTPLDGTGGPSFQRVLKLTAGGDVVSLKIDDDPAFFGQEFRGKAWLHLENDRLVKSCPLYVGKEPNCCPEGGERRIFYRWDGKAFVVDRVRDVPPPSNPSRQ